MFNLKDFRENKIKMTQAEFAGLIGERQDYISRLEQSPGQMPINIVIKIAKATGTTIDELLNYQRPCPKPLEVDNTWITTDFTKKSLVDYIDKCGADYVKNWGDRYHHHIKDLRDKVNRVIVKPKVAVVGHSDVGKSRLINSLLGLEKMPTSWTPTTAITVYIKHIGDRPKFIEEEVWIFKAEVDGSIGWDEKRLSEEKYCRNWKLASGSADILASYGTRQSELYESNQAGAAVVFIESALLKNCDVIDLPGFHTGDRVEDDLMTLKAKEDADVLIYMSLANGFLRGPEIEYLKESINTLNVLENQALNNLSPLSNLFIVSSQAHTVDGGNLTSLNDILDKGCTRFAKSMPDEFWQNKREISGYNYDYRTIRSRFFTYSTDIDELRSKFELQIKQMLERLPELIDEKAKEFVRAYIKELGMDMDREIEKFSEIKMKRVDNEKLLKEIKRNEPRRANDNQQRRMALISDIRSLSRESVESYASSYGKIITVDNILRIIKEKDFKKKKEDMETLVSYINSTLQVGLQGILKAKSELLKERIDQYLADFKSSIQYDTDNIRISGIKVTFDPTKAFVSGLAGLAVYGGLAFWAGSLGNLGAYILVAKGVSILSALGISISGGTATAAATVAAIGGPVVIGIALAVVVALFTSLLFSGGWEKSVAKKIVKEYDTKKCLMKYNEVIQNYWKDTERAFNAGADKLDEQWKKYVVELEEMVISYDVKDIERRIDVANGFKHFLSGIPL